jgi:hypothetical protein
MCHSSNIWEQEQQIKMLFKRKLSGDRIRVIIATIRPRNFCLLICFQKNVKIRTHKTIILHVVLWVCETWSLTLRQKHRLRVFENMVLRTIFGPKRDEATGGWRKRYREELRDLCYWLSIIRIMKSRRMKWAGHVARMGMKRTACRLLVRNTKWMKSLGRSRRRWVDNTKMDHVEVRWGGVDWIGLAQDMDTWKTLVNAVMNLMLQWNSGKLSNV